MRQRVVGVTGASGYVGRAFARKAEAAGWYVVALGRRAAPHCQEWRHADLREPPAAGLLDGLDALVHLAADTGNNQLDSKTQTDFAVNLFSSGADKGLRMIFVSSQAASERAPSDYGRIKAGIESSILSLGATAVRPGLIYGDEPMGLYGMLVAFVRKSPFIPVLLPRPLVWPIHVDDVAVALLRALDDRSVSGRVLSIGGEALPFDGFLCAIAVHRVRRWRLPLPVPTVVVRAALLLLARVLGPAWSPSRLDSLTRLPSMQPAPSLSALELSPRALRDGFSRGGADVRALLTEGVLLLRAAAGGSASVWTARRYVRILRGCGAGTPLHIPFAARAFPLLLASIDRPTLRATAPVGAPIWRLGVALRLAETDRRLTERFLMTRGHGGVWPVVGSLVLGALVELLARAAQPLAGSWNRPHG